MKTLIIILFSLLALGTIKAQDFEVQYTYDAAGNRIKREMVELKIGRDADADLEPTEETWGERQILLFPNPTKGNLSVQIKGGDTEGNYQYHVFNAAGSKVLDGTFNAIGEHTIPMSPLSPGLYFLVLQKGDEKLSYKIIKE